MIKVEFNYNYKSIKHIINFIIIFKKISEIIDKTSL